jgi:hypothetical protein
MSVGIAIIEVSTRKVPMNTKRIHIIISAGIEKSLPYTTSGLAWAKEMFEDGEIISWELVEA